jgi:copper chaperone CopZ
MSCASCVAKIEKALTRLSGVAAASVNLAAEKAAVTYDPARVGVPDLSKAIENLGSSATSRSPLATPRPIGCMRPRIALATRSKYWEMHDRLFDDPHRADPKDLVAHASALGLDAPRFERCLAGGVHVARVRQGVADGEKARVRGTPTFFLGLTEPSGAPIRPQRLIIGAQPYPAFKQAIDSLLAEPR